jgi:hypothetical protein
MAENLALLEFEFHVFFVLSGGFSYRLQIGQATVASNDQQGASLAVAAMTFNLNRRVSLASSKEACVSCDYELSNFALSLLELR